MQSHGSRFFRLVPGENTREGISINRTVVADIPIAALPAASGIVVIVRMYETHARHDCTPTPDDVDLES
jgi:hypothetical protein